MQELLIPTKIIRCKRRSIALIIENNGDFIVRVPIKAEETAIYKFINEKSQWIIKKRTEQLNNQPKPVLLLDNEKLSILGKEYIIKLSNFSRVKVADNAIFIPNSNPK